MNYIEIFDEKIILIKNDIRKTLNLLNKVKCNVIFENTKVIIFSDILDLDIYEEQIIHIYDVLNEKISKYNYFSLDGIILNKFFRDFEIIPLINDKSIDGIFYNFPLITLMNKTFNELKPHDLIQNKINNIFIEKNKIDILSNYPLIIFINEVISSINALLFILNHIISIIEINIIDDLGIDIIKNYINDLSLDTSNLFDFISNSMSIIYKEINDFEYFPNIIDFNNCILGFAEYFVTRFLSENNSINNVISFDLSKLKKFTENINESIFFVNKIRNLFIKLHLDNQI